MAGPGRGFATPAPLTKLPILYACCLPKSTPPAAAQARERHRRLRTLAAAGAALLTVLLLLAVESWQQSALQSRVDISTGRDALGMPADTPVAEGASDETPARTGWWSLWQVG